MMEEKKVHRLLVIGSDDKIVVKLSIGDIAGTNRKKLISKQTETYDNIM